MTETNLFLESEDEDAANSSSEISEESSLFRYNSDESDSAECME